MSFETVVRFIQYRKIALVQVMIMLPVRGVLPIFFSQVVTRCYKQLLRETESLQEISTETED